MAIKVSVSERALIQRINRKLMSDEECIKKTRGNAARDLGDYYRLDFNRNTVVGKDVDIEALGRELGVLRKFESLKEA